MKLWPAVAVVYETLKVSPFSLNVSAFKSLYFSLFSSVFFSVCLYVSSLSVILRYSDPFYSRSFYFFNMSVVLPLFIDMHDMSNLSLHLSKLVHVRNGNMTKAEAWGSNFVIKLNVCVVSPSIKICFIYRSCPFLSF